MQLELDTQTVIAIFDIIGMVACSIAGTTLAMQKRFDFFGCILVSMVNAIGGGTLRDVMLDRHPLFWMKSLTAVMVITITSLLCQMFFVATTHQRVEQALKFFDAIGLAAFTVIGLTVSLSFGMHPLIAILMGVMTSIAGGVMRDMICQELPLVLQKEIYITASILGSVVYLVLSEFSFGLQIREAMALLTAFTVRMLAVKYDWHLPSINLFGHR